ncbi:MAG: hypothetical protein IKP66_04235 [Lachnospiraceae bacterium]|nr:hypothetical protein [Lachnospiraceae bacterium]
MGTEKKDDVISTDQTEIVEENVESVENTEETKDVEEVREEEKEQEVEATKEEEVKEDSKEEDVKDESKTASVGEGMSFGNKLEQTKQVEKKSKEKKADKEEKKADKEDEKEKAKLDNSKSHITLIAVALALVISLFVVIPFITDKNSKSANETTKEVSNSVNITVLTDALAQLKTKDNYIISTYVQAPMGNTSYIEYVTPEMSATLVDDANIETAYQAQDLTQANYRVNDVIKDGHLYFVYDNTDEDGNAVTEIYQAPDNYAKECSARRYMFFDWMKDNLTDLEYVENTETDLGNGTVSMDVYKATLSSDAVKRILGNGTYTLYKMVQDTTENEGLKKLMGWLADDIEFTLVYSDANALFGIVDGSLAYVNLEIGGLGSKMYVTKCFIEDTTVASKVTIPELTNVVSYEDLYADYGNMALEYDSMEDMYNALYYGNNFTEEQLQEILDNAVQGAEESQGTDIETEVNLDGESSTESDATTESSTESDATTESATESTTESATEETSN